MKNIGLIIRKYTDSILDCLKEEKSRVIEELNNLKIAFEEDTSLGKYINSQLLNKSQKIEIIDSISEKLKLHQFTKNFLVLLIKNDKFS
jgi:F0F1-type ATP synthase delta subunit